MKSNKKSRFWEECDLKHGVSYECDKNYSCNDNGCDQWSCRCCVITNAHVIEVLLDRVAKQLLNSAFGDLFPDELNVYCIERILRAYKMYNCENYEVHVCRGYYGDEICGVTMSPPEGLIKTLCDFVLLKESSRKIEYILNLEYNKVLPECKDREWEIKEIQRDLIHMGSEDHANRVKNEDLSMYKNWNLPCGIVIKQGKKYRLIDGYHRMTASTKDKVKVVVAR